MTHVLLAVTIAVVAEAAIAFPHQPASLRRSWHQQHTRLAAALLVAATGLTLTFFDLLPAQEFLNGIWTILILQVADNYLDPQPPA